MQCNELSRTSKCSAHLEQWTLLWSMFLYLSVCVQSLSRLRLFVAPWTVACQPPLPMDFSRQEYWSGVPFPASEDLPEPGIKTTSLGSPALSGGFFTGSATWGAVLYLRSLDKSYIFTDEEDKACLIQSLLIWGRELDLLSQELLTL